LPPRSSGAADAEQAVGAYDASKGAVTSLAIDLVVKLAPTASA